MLPAQEEGCVRKEGNLKEIIKQLLFPLRCPVCDRPVPNAPFGRMERVSARDVKAVLNGYRVPSA